MTPQDLDTNITKADAVETTGGFLQGLVGLNGLQTATTTTFAPEKAYTAVGLTGVAVGSIIADHLPAASATVQARGFLQPTLDKDGKQVSDGIFQAVPSADTTKIGASYFDPLAWTKDIKLVAGNNNAYTLQATSDDGKKTLTISEAATGKAPYGDNGTDTGNGVVREAVIFTGSDNDKFVHSFASNAVNVPDASAIAGSSVDALTTAQANSYVNVNKGIAYAEKINNVHSFKEVNGVQALSNANEYAMNYKDKGMTIISASKYALNEANYAKLDKATLVENTATNYYYDNSNPTNAVQMHYVATQAHTFNKTSATEAKDVIITNLAKYSLVDNTQLDNVKVEAKGIVTATTTNGGATAFTYTNPSYTVSNNAYQLTVKSFSTTSNGLVNAYFAAGNVSSPIEYELKFGANDRADHNIVATPAVKDADGKVIQAALPAHTAITGTSNDDEIKIVIPTTKVDATNPVAFNASGTINDGTGKVAGATVAGNTTGGTANGGAGNDTIIGGALDDNLTGGAGADVLTGGAGSDKLTGGLGKDTFIVDAGTDKIQDFDPTMDTLIVKPGATALVLDTADGVAYYRVFTPANAKETVIDTLDKLNTAKAAVDGGAVPVVDFSDREKDDITPISGKGTKDLSEKIIGSDFKDNFRGFKGDDSITGNGGDDKLEGGEGNDVIDGGKGADVLIGGAGTDKLTGGAGADTFQFTAKPENDVITDFKSGEDKIDLFAIDANTTPAPTPALTGAALTAFNAAVNGNQAFSSTILNGAATPFTAAGQLRFDATTNTLQGNTDADFATVEFSIVLTGVTAVAATDFVL